LGDETLLTTADVMAYLHLNLRTLYRLIRTGVIPAIRVGRQWRFRKSDIDRVLAAQTDARGRRRVLVVDDEDAIRDAIASALLEAYDVDTAVSGPAAIEQLRSIDYDLLITDLKMPGMDGLSVIREARRRKSDLHVLIITGQSSEASAIEALNMGVNGYLTKPFLMQRLVATAARAMGTPAGGEQASP
jgi:excisionase family DNA binding protein